jgi:hypothetical protein
MRRHTLAAALAGLCLAAVPAAALGAEGPETAAAPPESAELSAGALTVTLTIDEGPEAPPAPAGEANPDQPPPPDDSRPEAPPAPLGEESP